MMDPIEIAHSITIEAIRAGLNRPEEIKDLFKTVVEQARGVSDASPPTPAAVDEEEEEEIRPQPEIVTEEIRPQPAAQPEAATAPLPSKAWQESPQPPKPRPKADEAPVAAHLSPEEIAASHGDEFIKCLECGQTKQQIRNHLNKIHRMSVDEYKAKWGLPADYPTIAPATRRRFQERGRIAYATQQAAGTGLAGHPGPKKPKEQAAA